MPNKEKAEITVDKHSIEEHVVEIRTRESHEELWIDGVRRRFFVTDDGYTLHDDAYAPPQLSLIQATKNYLQKTTMPGHDH